MTDVFNEITLKAFGVLVAILAAVGAALHKGFRWFFGIKAQVNSNTSDIAEIKAQGQKAHQERVELKDSISEMKKDLAVGTEHMKSTDESIKRVEKQNSDIVTSLSGITKVLLEK